MSLAQVSHKKEALKRDIALLAQRSSNGLHRESSISRSQLVRSGMAGIPESRGWTIPWAESMLLL